MKDFLAWKQWYANQPFDYPPNARDAWFACKNEVIKLLEEDLELDSISYNGKKVYKIYGTVIDKIRKL